MPGLFHPTDVSKVLAASIIRAMEAVSFPETSVSICQTTWSNISEDRHLRCFTILSHNLLGLTEVFIVHKAIYIFRCFVA
jgi:hypothetical protein